MTPGRNDPCPCGSGKKFKHCCMMAQMAPAGTPEDLVWRRLRRLKDDTRYVSTLLRFIDDVYGGEAIEEAWDEFTLWQDEPFDPDSPHMSVFVPWLFAQWAPDPEETTVVDASLHGVPPLAAFLQRKGRRQDPLLREYMESCLAAPLSFHEILHCEPGLGVRLQDVLTGEIHEVREREGTRHVQVGDLLFGQLASAGGVTLLEACSPVMLPPGEKIAVIQLRQVMARGAVTASRDALREYDLELRQLYLDLAERILYPQMPELHNTDGDKLVLQRLVFDIESAQEAYDALRDLDFEAAPDDEPAEAQYDADGNLRCATVAWKKAGNSQDASFGNTMLGRIRIEGGHMLADVNSYERAETLRRLVAERLGDRARHRATEIQSLERALEDDAGGRAPPPSAEDRALRDSPELSALVAEYVARHYDRWIDEAIPALGGRTPRAAMRDPEGAELVEALVDDAERLGQRMDPPVDPAVFRRLRERLGLAVGD